MRGCISNSLRGRELFKILSVLVIGRQDYSSGRIRRSEILFRSLAPPRQTSHCPTFTSKSNANINSITMASRLRAAEKRTFYLGMGLGACTVTGLNLYKMAPLSRPTQDRLFFLGIGLGACAVVGLMRHLLENYRDAAALPPSENKTQYIDQKVEDSLKVSTLDKLLDSTNYSIQETTAIIICERAIYDRTSLDTILHYITRPDYDTREKSIKTLSFMVHQCMSMTSLALELY